MNFIRLGTAALAATLVSLPLISSAGLTTTMMTTAGVASRENRSAW